jgi:hypothetical protein
MISAFGVEHGEEVAKFGFPKPKMPGAGAHRAPGKPMFNTSSAAGTRSLGSKFGQFSQRNMKPMAAAGATGVAGGAGGYGLSRRKQNQPTKPRPM